MFCFDADERVTGDLRGFMEGTHSSDYDGVRVQLFDAYMTPGDHAPYQADRDCWASSFLRPGTARHSDVVAKPVGGHLAKHHARERAA